MDGKLERVRERFKRTLKERLSLRLHMFFLLMGVLSVAALLGYALYHAGVRSMPLRYGLVTVCSYMALFLLMRLWLYYLIDDREVRAKADEVLLAAGGAPEPRHPRKGRGGSGGVGDAVYLDVGSSGESSGGSGSGSIGSLDVDGEGAIILIVVAVVLVALFSVGIFLVWQAPLIFSDVLFQVVLAGALQRSARHLDTEHWATSLFKATWWTLLVALVVTVGGGAIVQHLCPGATKLSEVIRHCL